MKTSLPLELARSIGECLEYYAALRPDQRAYTFLSNGEDQERPLTYGALRSRSRALGNELRRRGLSGKTALLLFPAGLEFIVAFFGCMYAGVIAVPANLARNSHHYARLRQIIGDSQAQATLTTSALRASVQDGLALAGVDRQSVPVLCETDAGPLDVSGFEPGQANDIAFLQYTSGSTGQPKGVMVSHAQLMANARAIQRAADLPEHLVVGGWLPQFHDMGLIGTTLAPVALGGHCVFMSPLHFIQRPMRWLRMLSRYGCRATAAPNFAIELCVKAALDDSPAGLDLSRLRTLFCGAEPVDARTADLFEQKFAGMGLAPGAFQPCYGLAEATLMVSGGPSPQGRTLQVSRDALAAGKVDSDASRPTQAVTCCGAPVAEHKTRIVDPASGRLLADNEVGEVWFSGPSVASGYWRNPAATQATFQAMTACGEGPFMRTGDLGFVRDGGLYITGRIKELIILRGRNLYPHDIESTLMQAGSHFSDLRAAVFAIDDVVAEGIVAYLELPRRSRPERADLVRVAADLRHAVSQGHDVQLRDLYFVAHGAIPRTSSGKTQRRQCAALYRSGEIDSAGETLFSTRLPMALETQEQMA